MTEYVATRWYRAPEIMLTSVSLISLGFAFADVFESRTGSRSTRTLSTSGPSDVSSQRCSRGNRSSQVSIVRSSAPTHLPSLMPFATSDHHQLTLILDVLGTPTLDDFYAISSHRSRDYLRALPFKKRKPFAGIFPDANPLAVDLLGKCLAFNPLKRIGVEA